MHSKSSNLRELDNDLSDQTLAFEPGFEVNGKMVCRTFQPSYVVTRDGVVIAFCQGRLVEGRDDDPKMILASKSDDWGATWSRARAISPSFIHYAISAYIAHRNGRERVSVLSVVDMHGTKAHYRNDFERMKAETGIDIDVVGRETPMVLCRFDSDDNGDNWAMEVLLGNRTPLNHRYDDGILIMFNPVGQVHVIPDGPNRGRFIIGGPATVVPDGEALSDHFRNHHQSGSGIIYSDDQGETWHAHGFITDYLANEASAVSTRGGEELLIVRRMSSPRVIEERSPLSVLRPGPGQRIAHTSADCGKTWSPPFLVDISGTLCHGTLARIADRLVFSIPNGSVAHGETPQHSTERRRGAIYFSSDQGQTWEHKLIEPETFAYSTVGRINESQCIVLYARGTGGQDGVGCRVFGDAWLGPHM